MSDDQQNPKEVAKQAMKDMREHKKEITIEEISEGVYRATYDKSKYIIEYDKNKCIGAASCAAIAMNTFIMNDENKAEIRKDVEAFDDDQTILDAAISCPVFAIKIIDKETNEVVFPTEDLE